MFLLQGHYYSRVSNPTRDALQTCLATLDNGKHGLVFPSGCAAVTALLHLVKAGDHIISCNEQYGGTRLLLLDYVKIQGIELDFVDTADLDWVENTIKPNTKVTINAIEHLAHQILLTFRLWFFS